MKKFILSVVFLLVFFSYPASIIAQSFQMPLQNAIWNHGYGAFNGINNYMYHTGIDLRNYTDVSKYEFNSPVYPASDGNITFIIGLAGQQVKPTDQPGDNLTDEKFFLWDDKNNDYIFNPEYDEIIEVSNDDSIKKTNHGLGCTVIIEHIVNGQKFYSLYAHLDAINKVIYESVVVKKEPYEVKTNIPIGIYGNSEYSQRRSARFNPHLHFEIKFENSLGSKNIGSQYYGYTPDLPNTYAYVDPLLYIYPQPLATNVFKAIKVIGEEGGISTTDKGVRIYSGPGIKYSVLGWTGKDQILVARSKTLSNTHGDEVPDRIWYKIDIQNRAGRMHGWVPAHKKNGDLLLEESDLSTTYLIKNDDKVGWLLRTDLSKIDDNPNSDTNNILRVWDNLNKSYLSVKAWNNQMYVKLDEDIKLEKKYSKICIPKIHFNNPKDANINNLINDNPVGEVEFVWIDSTALSLPKGDLNADGRVDVTDLGILLSSWGNNQIPKADINKDGIVDVTDLGILLSNWTTE